MKESTGIIVIFHNWFTEPNFNSICSSFMFYDRSFWRPACDSVWSTPCPQNIRCTASAYDPRNMRLLKTYHTILLLYEDTQTELRSIDMFSSSDSALLYFNFNQWKAFKPVWLERQFERLPNPDEPGRHSCDENSRWMLCGLEFRLLLKRA